MKILKTLSIGLMLLVLATAVPVAAVAVDYEASSGASATPSSKQTHPSAPASAQDAALLIRHQKAHCHAWSYNGDGYTADQAAQLAVGDSITVTNNDVMSHRLVELSGPSTTITTAAMDKIGATSKVTFATPGTYILGTKPGEDYSKGIVTTGNDNVLRVKVVVS
jgi:plastocyanin